VDKPPILIDAFRACGSLFVKTTRASDFTARTLASSRETLVHEFVSTFPAAFTLSVTHLVTGPFIVYVRGIDVLGDRRIFASDDWVVPSGSRRAHNFQSLSRDVAHGTLSHVSYLTILAHVDSLQVVRRSGLIQRCAEWRPPEIDPSNPATIELAWHAWAKHETGKR
jgi:hypothetical protein